MVDMIPNQSTVFLLGSGTSVPAGFPRTSDITDQVFSGKDVIRHTDSRYYLQKNPTDLENHETQMYLPNVILLLQVIKDLMGNYNKEEILNYEIIYYFIQQLHDYESGDLLNMALYPFIHAVKDKFLLRQKNQPRFIELFNEAENYIRHSVWRKLAIPANNHMHLSFLSEALNDKDFDAVNIGTLNHDLLIETHLTQNMISFNDGFGSSVNGVRYWENSFSNTHNLLKLHGSINWFNLCPDNGGWFDDKIGIVNNNDIDHARSTTGGLMRSLPEKEPRILIGTFNKIYEYSDNIFSDIFHKFREVLTNSSSLVVSGYSFGDKGINSSILDWLYGNRKNRVILIHYDPEGILTSRARGAIRKAYTGPARDNFTLISKNIEDVDWLEIKSCLLNP